MRLMSESPLPVSGSVYVEDEYEIDNDIPDACRMIMPRKVRSCSPKFGRTGRSSMFTLFYRYRSSYWDDYLPILPFRMGRWSGPLLGLAIAFGADLTRSRCQSWGLRWFLSTCLKTTADQAVFWSIAQRMPNLLDFLSARLFARVSLTICNYTIKPSSWSFLKRIGLSSLIEFGMLRTMRSHLVMFYTQRLLMAVVKPTMFTVVGENWWKSELIFLGRVISEWGCDEIARFVLSFLTTVFWPDFALDIYGGCHSPPPNI